MKALEPETVLAPRPGAPARAEADGWAAVPDLFRTLGNVTADLAVARIVSDRVD